MPRDDSATAPGKSSDRRILVIDDNDVIRDVLREFLGAMYQVDCASNGDEALKLITVQPPHLILLDLKLPGIDGMTLLRSLRKAGDTTPVVVITGYGSTAGADEASHYGVKAFLEKPFDLRQLDRLVDDVMNGRTTQARFVRSTPYRRD